ncbi:hypothetical protein [Phaffia rhodozyma]|uniref:Secreted protein n=1 Tax=Phaffia rhodozyma TaxID=264483 RepID=A0A0F7SNV0_PHARH|nr:hypothetical protein [Phaffia rhodozyma]
MLFPLMLLPAYLVHCFSHRHGLKRFETTVLNCSSNAFFVFSPSTIHQAHLLFSVDLHSVPSSSHPNKRRPFPQLISSRALYTYSNLPIRIYSTVLPSSYLLCRQVSPNAQRLIKRNFCQPRCWCIYPENTR